MVFNHRGSRKGKRSVLHSTSSELWATEVLWYVERKENTISRYAWLKTGTRRKTKRKDIRGGREGREREETKRRKEEKGRGRRDRLEVDRTTFAQVDGSSASDETSLPFHDVQLGKQTVVDSVITGDKSDQFL